MGEKNYKAQSKVEKLTLKLSANIITTSRPVNSTYLVAVEASPFDFLYTLTSPDALPDAASEDSPLISQCHMVDQKIHF